MTIVTSFATAASLPPQTLSTSGKYVAVAADCVACHSKPMTGKPFAGGYGLVSPVGVIYSTNITPSREYGIGGYSEAQFKRAVREGVAADGRHLYPAMPYTDYSGMTDADVHLLYDYFMTKVVAVDEPPAQITKLGFPFNLRFAMVGWNWLFLTQHNPDLDAHTQLGPDRGRYLVDALGHCGSCHTPRNAAMESEQSRYLAGADLGGWHAPNITSDAVSGIGGWSTSELVSLMKNGHAVDKAQAAGPMAEAVENSLRLLSDEDLELIADYLKSVPAKANSNQVKTAFSFGQAPAMIYAFDNAESSDVINAAYDARAASAGAPSHRGMDYDFNDVTDGAILFQSACASCHQPSGRGTTDHYYPSLFHNTATGAATADNLVMAILDGVHRIGGDGVASMPGFAADMNDTQIAAVASFVAAHFGNPVLMVSAEHVGLLRSGGPVPAIRRYMPALLFGCVIVLLTLLTCVWLLWRRHGRARAR